MQIKGTELLSLHHRLLPDSLAAAFGIATEDAGFRGEPAAGPRTAPLKGHGAEQRWSSPPRKRHAPGEPGAGGFTATEPSDTATASHRATSGPQQARQGAGQQSDAAAPSVSGGQAPAVAAAAAAAATAQHHHHHHRAAASVAHAQAAAAAAAAATSLQTTSSMSAGCYPGTAAAVAAQHHGQQQRGQQPQQHQHQHGQRQQQPAAASMVQALHGFPAAAYHFAPHPLLPYAVPAASAPHAAVALSNLPGAPLGVAPVAVYHHGAADYSRVLRGQQQQDDDGDDTQARALKRPRLVWTPKLHKLFEEAVQKLGPEKAVPKTIMQVMNVEGLTRENVASHLQKYRLSQKKAADAGDGDKAGGGGGGDGAAAADGAAAGAGSGGSPEAQGGGAAEGRQAGGGGGERRSGGAASPSATTGGGGGGVSSESGDAIGGSVDATGDGGGSGSDGDGDGDGKAATQSPKSAQPPAGQDADAAGGEQAAGGGRSPLGLGD